jgi:hypothetical protein
MNGHGNHFIISYLGILNGHDDHSVYYISSLWMVMAIISVSKHGLEHQKRKPFLWYWWYPSCTLLLMVRLNMHEFGNGGITNMMNGTYLWLFVTQIVHSWHDDDRKAFKNIIACLFYISFWLLRCLSFFDIRLLITKLTEYDERDIFVIICDSDSP